jgi:hypothetical protein
VMIEPSWKACGREEVPGLGLPPDRQVRTGSPARTRPATVSAPRGARGSVVARSSVCRRVKRISRAAGISGREANATHSSARTKPSARSSGLNWARGVYVEVVSSFGTSMEYCVHSTRSVTESLLHALVSPDIGCVADRKVRQHQRVEGGHGLLLGVVMETSRSIGVRGRYFTRW